MAAEPAGAARGGSCSPWSPRSSCSPLRPSRCWTSPATCPAGWSRTRRRPRARPCRSTRPARPPRTCWPPSRPRPARRRRVPTAALDAVLAAPALGGARRRHRGRRRHRPGRLRPGRRRRAHPRLGGQARHLRRRAHRLGPQHRFATRVVRGGAGQVVLVGGGDATLTTRRSRPAELPQRASLAELADQVAAAVGPQTVPRATSRSTTRCSPAPPCRRTGRRPTSAPGSSRRSARCRSTPAGCGPARTPASPTRPWRPVTPSPGCCASAASTWRPRRPGHRTGRRPAAGHGAVADGGRDRRARAADQ